MSDPNPTDSNSYSDGRLWPRWLFLRALGLIFFSAFYSLAFQIHGLIGERGILPVHFYFYQLSAALGAIERAWHFAQATHRPVLVLVNLMGG